MSHQIQNIEDYHSGDSLTLNVDVIDDDGNAVDISGSTIEYEVYESGTGSTVVSKTTAGGINITDGPSGEFDISIDPADTQDLSGAYRHECELTDGAGNVSTIFTGKFRVKSDSIE